MEHQHADTPHPIRLLRARRERPRRSRAAEQRDELAPPPWGLPSSRNSGRGYHIRGNAYCASQQISAAYIGYGS